MMDEQTWTSIKWGTRGLGGVGVLMLDIWAGWNPIFQLLVGLVIADIASGVLAGVIERKISSDATFRGMARKGLMLIIVGVAAFVGSTVELPLLPLVAGFYCGHEGLSIFENAVRVGLPVPAILRDVLLKLQSKTD